jgi:hypothetical protein
VGVENNSTISEAPRLALSANELATQVKNKVVPLVGPKWDEDPITTTDQFAKDCGFSSQADIDGMRARRRRLQAFTRGRCHPNANISRKVQHVPR